MSEDVKILNKKIKELQLDNDKLSRRVKLLTKRIKKLQEENVEINDELDKVEAIHDKVGISYKSKEEGCPKCNSRLIKISLHNGQTQIICEDVVNCNYKVRI